MHSLRSEDKYETPGRGIIFIVKSPVESPRGRIGSVIGPRVIIDGTEYQLLSVELYDRQEPVWVGEAISLVVRRIKNELKDCQVAPAHTKAGLQVFLPNQQNQQEREAYVATTG